MTPDARHERAWTAGDANNRARAIGEALFVFTACFVASLLLYFQRDLFFFWDEWDALRVIATRPLHETLFLPHNEHLLPVFRLYYGIIVPLCRENYAAYVVINCAIHAGSCTLLYVILTRLSIGRACALAAVALYLASRAHCDNVCHVFQAQILLSVLFGLLSAILFARYLENARFASGALASLVALLSAWSFTTGIVMTFSLCLWGAWHFIQSRRHGMIAGQWSARFLPVCILAIELCSYWHFKKDLPEHENLYIAPEGSGILTWAAQLPRVLVTCASAAIWGPMQAVWPNAPRVQTLAMGAVVSMVVIVAVLAVTWRTRYRAICIGILVNQMLLFLPIAFGRGATGIESGMISRYQSFGMPGWLAILAIMLHVLLSRRALVPRGLCVAILLLLSVCLWENIRLGSIVRENYGLRRGRANRDDYSRLKQQMLSAEGSMPDLWLTKSAHPGYSMSRLVLVIGLLDPQTRPFLPREFRPVTATGQRKNNSTTQHIAPGAPAVQSWRVARPGRLESVSILVGFGEKPFVADCAFEITDATGTLLARRTVPGSLLVNNGWVSVNFNGTPISANREYRLVVQCGDPNKDHQFVIWTNSASDGFEAGECITPGMSGGDLCFELLLSADTVSVRQDE